MKLNSLTNIQCINNSNSNTNPCSDTSLSLY